MTLFITIIQWLAVCIDIVVYTWATIAILFAIEEATRPYTEEEKSAQKKYDI